MMKLSASCNVENNYRFIADDIIRKLKIGYRISFELKIIDILFLLSPMNPSIV